MDRPVDEWLDEKRAEGSKTLGWAESLGRKAMEKVPGLEEKVAEQKKKLAIASYSLTSLGYDGVLSSDDLIMEGGTPLHEKIQEKRRALSWGRVAGKALEILVLRRSEKTSAESP